MASAARLNPFDESTYDVYRAGLVSPTERARTVQRFVESACDMAEIEACWWERAVYERAVRLFERRVLLVRVQGNASAYMTALAARVPDLYYPHEVDRLLKQVQSRDGAWNDVAALCNNAISNYADLTPEQLRNGLRIKDWMIDQERSASVHRDKLSSTPSFAPASTSTVCCRKCKASEVTVTLRQLRSADEPMTQCFACLNPTCRFQWRVG